jgi:ABC-type lipoprotein release transport system permease subunit
MVLGGGGGAAAAAVWARADLRRRWRSLVLLGVLAGVTAAFAMASLAGARRTGTALARLKATTDAPSALVFASQSGVFDPDFARLRARPEVADLAVWDLVFGLVDGQVAVLFASDDGRWGRDISRPVLIAGRMWGQNAADEVVVDENQAKQGTPIGSTVRLSMVGPTVQDLISNTPNGPSVTLKVVGVVREVRQFLIDTSGQAFLGPAFVHRYRGRAAIHPNADVVLLNPSSSAVASLRRDVNDIVGPGTPVLDLHAVERRVVTTLSVERGALLLLAVALAVAGGLLVTQALARSAAIIGEDARVLRSIGLTRWDVAGAAGLSHILSAVIAAAVAFTLSWRASGWFPVGLGRRLDPGVGTHVDWTVAGPGALITVILMLAATLAVAWRTSSIDVGRTRSEAPSLIIAIRRWAPLSIGLGASMAFERGRGRTSTPVRPALVGAVVGVLGVIGALTINQGLHDALAHPERAGVTWNLTVTPPTDEYTTAGVKADFLAATMRASGGVIAVIDRHLVPIAGVGVPTFSIRPVGDLAPAPIRLRLLEGRAPRADAEVVIGPATARELHARIGDTIKIGDQQLPARIVGEGLFPSDVHAEFDEGIWLTPTQLNKIVPPDPHGRSLAVRLGSRQSDRAAISRLTKALPPGTAVNPAEVPVELANLRNVRTLPILLAGFLALLATAAVSHVLVTSSRRRRRDFAILRTLGLKRRDARLLLNAQGSMIGLVGLVVGIPVGVAAGRTIWRLVTERVPLANVPPFALVAVALTVPITAIIVNALAVGPGRGVVRRSPAEELRSE